MLTTLRLLPLIGYVVGCVACGWCSLNLLEKSLDTPGIMGHVLSWLAGLNTLGVVVNAVGFYRALPGNEAV